MPQTKKAYINPLGFREYDARWLYKKEINLEGIKLQSDTITDLIVRKSKRSL